MRTWLTYENRSLNPHIGRLGLFWDVANAAPGIVPVLWAAIEKCRFGWHHPVCIDWQPTFLLQDSWGNQHRLTLGVTDTKTGTRIDGPYGFGLNSQIIFSQNTPRSDLSLLICRNNGAIAQLPLSRAGSWRLTMPDRLVLQIECPVKLRSKIIDSNGTAFSLNGLKSLKVALRGGTPGAASTPLTLISYDGKSA